MKSLDQFLKSYTSEDNESFEEIVIENEKKQRSKVRVYFLSITTIKRIFKYLFKPFLSSSVSMVIQRRKCDTR